MAGKRGIISDFLINFLYDIVKGGGVTIMEWIKKEGPEELAKGIRNAFKEYRYDGWREVINLKDDLVDEDGKVIHKGNREVSFAIQRWRDERVEKTKDDPEAEVKMVNPIGFLWLSINGAEEAELSLLQKKVEMRHTLINMCLDENNEISEEKFFADLDAFSGSKVKQRAASFALFMHKQVQKIVPDQLKGADVARKFAEHVQVFAEKLGHGIEEALSSLESYTDKLYEARLERSKRLFETDKKRGTISRFFRSIF